MNDDEVIQQIVETIRDEYEPEKIILFGSRVWGRPHQDSDLDVLVVKESEKHEVERIRDVSRIVRRFQQHPHLLPIDILVKTPDELQYRLQMGDHFMRHIVDRGRVVHDRSTAR